jgi:hypothetical protein
VGSKTKTVQIELSSPPDFALTSPILQQTVKPGDIATFSIAIQPKGGFSLPVTLRTDGLPTTVKAEFSPKEIKPLDVTFSQLTLTVSAETPRGEYKFSVLGTAEDKFRIEVSQMIIHLSGFIKRLKLEESEVEFLKAFSQGRIQTDLLFDKEQAKQLDQHPSLLLAVRKQGRGN